MKKHVKNHRFIPISFIEKLETTSYENNNKLILFLLILNLFIVPNSFNKISNIFKSNEDIPVISINEDYKDTNKENLSFLLSTINNEIKNIRIENNRGFIEVNSIEEIYNMESEGKLKIKSVVMEEDSFIIEVELWKREIYYTFLSFY